MLERASKATSGAEFNMESELQEKAWTYLENIMQFICIDEDTERQWHCMYTHLCVVCLANWIAWIRSKSKLFFHNTSDDGENVLAYGVQMDTHM